MGRSSPQVLLNKQQKPRKKMKRDQIGALIEKVESITSSPAYDTNSCEETTSSSSSTDAACEQPLHAIISSGLASVDKDTLHDYVMPIWKTLERLDAELLLSLERCKDGAALFDG